MKGVYYFSLLLVFFLFSCNNTDKVIETAWNDFENEQYVSAMEKFSGIAKKYKNDWNKGYSQECQVLRYLYFTEKISQEQFLVIILIIGIAVVSVGNILVIEGVLGPKVNKKEKFQE